MADERTNPNDPEPDEMRMGGMAYRRAFDAWEKRQEEWRAANPLPGPAPKPSATGGGGGGTHTPSGAYDLTGFSAGAIAEAMQEATDFASWLGYPTWFNIDAEMKNVLQLGVQGDSSAAFQYLWTQLAPDRQKDNINAYFGLSKQQYLEKANNLKDLYYMYTGDTAVPDEFRNQALKENWSATEMMSALQKNATIGETAPWLAVGMSFKDIVSQFGQVYGQAPKDKSVAASWWKFKTGAQSVVGGGPAQIAYQPPQPLVSRPLSSDVETR